MVICVATSLTSILPASAQNSDKTDEYKTLLKKIMTLSGSSASSEAIMSQFMSSMQKGPFQQDEAYWKDFAAKWTQKIEDKVDRKSTRLNSSHNVASRMPSSA